MKKKGFWQALESLTGGAVLAEWALELGDEFERSHHFLHPTQDAAKSYPCTSRIPCECAHRVERVREAQQVAVCDCGECAPIRLTESELTVWKLDVTRLAEAVMRACQWRRTDVELVAPGLWRIGEWAELRAPIFWCEGGSEATLRVRLDAPVLVLAAPFILLMPARGGLASRLDAALKRDGSLVLSAEELLAVADRGNLRLLTSLETARQIFGDRAAQRRASGKLLQEIHDRFEVFGANYRDLRSENDELRRWHAEGYFKFALKVDAADFQAFAVVIALGNRSAAAKHLKIPQRSFYDRVDGWQTRGREYQLMSRFIEWRKRSSRHIKVRLDESLQSGESGGQAENPETLHAVLEEVNNSASANYPDLLADILGALQRQNATNWPKVRDEVLGLIKEELPQ